MAGDSNGRPLATLDDVLDVLVDIRDLIHQQTDSVQRYCLELRDEENPDVVLCPGGLPVTAQYFEGKRVEDKWSHPLPEWAWREVTNAKGATYVRKFHNPYTSATTTTPIRPEPQGDPAIHADAVRSQAKVDETARIEREKLEAEQRRAASPASAAPPPEPKPKPERAAVDQCRGMTKAGKRCRRGAFGDTGFCETHADQADDPLVHDEEKLAAQPMTQTSVAPPAMTDEWRKLYEGEGGVRSLLTRILREKYGLADRLQGVDDEDERAIVRREVNLAFWSYFSKVGLLAPCQRDEDGGFDITPGTIDEAGLRSLTLSLNAYLLGEDIRDEQGG